MSSVNTNIVIGGAAGQGLATIGQLMAKAVTRAGYHLLVEQKYMSRVRGGHNTFAIRMGCDPVVSNIESVDILVALNAETLDLHKEDLVEDALVIHGDDIESEGYRALKIPFKELASKPLFHNVVALGVLGAAVGIDIKILESLLASVFKKKGDAIVESNLEVLKNAYTWVEGQDFDIFCAPPKGSGDGKIMMNGNEGIAMGALAAGCNFVSFYPMTPSTSVANALISKGRAHGLKFEQVEDEIAAMNMAIGASFAGAKAVVTTSGGGFALMVEESVSRVCRKRLS